VAEDIVVTHDPRPTMLTEAMELLTESQATLRGEHYGDWDRDLGRPSSVPVAVGDRSPVQVGNLGELGSSGQVLDPYVADSWGLQWEDIQADCRRLPFPMAMGPAG
jgi:hypothetical protein